jgi:hypothetical protein
MSASLSMARQTMMTAGADGLNGNDGDAPERGTIQFQNPESEAS